MSAFTVTAGMTPEEREEHRKRVAKKWRDANRAKMTAYMIEYRRANPERMRRIAADNRKRNIDKIIIRNIQRRINQLSATPAWADKARISDLYLLAKTLSREAGIQFDVDHIVPLRGAVVCGLHCEANLRLLPRYENQKKHNYFEEVWP